MFQPSKSTLLAFAMCLRLIVHIQDIISRANDMEGDLIGMGLHQGGKEGHKNQQEQQQSCWASVSGLLNPPQGSELDQSVV